MLTTAVAKFCMQCGAEYGGDEVTVCEKCGNERPAVEAPDVGVPNSTADAVLKDVILIGGLADVTFASLDMAQRCASKLRRQGRDARMASEYTTIHYDRETAADSGKPFSGWSATASRTEGHRRPDHNSEPLLSRVFESCGRQVHL
jgi:hypothetical protein